MPTTKREILNEAMSLARSARRAAIDALAPPRCPVSGERVAAPGDLHPKGWIGLHFIDRPFCARCGAPFQIDYGEGAVCAACIADPPSIDRVRAAVVFDDASASLISSFKFSDRTELALAFSRWMVRAGADILPPGAVLAPAPLHWRRLAARRFNQSAMLAQGVGALTGAPVLLSALKRTRATPPQREAPSSDARRRNVAGAFVVPEASREKIEGVHTVLIDDVYTTGATLSACAKALRAGGAASVDALVLARVVKSAQGAI